MQKRDDYQHLSASVDPYLCRAGAGHLLAAEGISDQNILWMVGWEIPTCHGCPYDGYLPLLIDEPETNVIL